jgi:hypothetical protein
MVGRRAGKAHFVKKTDDLTLLSSVAGGRRGAK